jgi:hypothetical protein
MKNVRVHRIENLERAMAELKAYGQVKTVSCEIDGGLIWIEKKTDSVLLVKCKCGAYDDVIRGI